MATQVRKERRIRRYVVVPLVATLTLLALAGLGVFFYLPTYVATTAPQPLPREVTVAPPQVEAFPVGVQPDSKRIVERDDVEAYLSTNLASNHRRQERGWFSRLAAHIVRSPLYQQLASPISRTLVIFSGERKEEAIDTIGDILRWDKSERLAFETLVASSTPVLSEGKFFPGTYVVGKDATPEDVAALINEKLAAEVLIRYTDEVERVVPFEDAMIIASLLEREAYDFEDMRYISGVIWNRLFIDMPLQLDATLQYVKGERPTEPWWPMVVPKDKYLDSPFNTYQNDGLPPAPIANPSVDAILAALNPRATDCLFYFHDQDGGFHCTENYEEHVAALKRIYGQGR